jgi:hypothetical protein
MVVVLVFEFTRGARYKGDGRSPDRMVIATRTEGSNFHAISMAE